MFLIIEVLINMCRTPKNGQEIEGIWDWDTGWQRAEYGNNYLFGWVAYIRGDDRPFRKLPLIWRGVK